MVNAQLANFTINIYPSGSMPIGNKKETIDDLLDGIDTVLGVT